MISACNMEGEFRASVMTSSVTRRMGKVRHNTLNQSDGPPPLRPPQTNNGALYEAALHSHAYRQADQCVGSHLLKRKY